MTEIILCMIVKNEAHVIERCLTHARSVVDAVCICDTGSTDATPELIEETLTGLGLPHRVCRHEWVNFGHNRSRSFVEARDYARELGWDLARSHALLLDADFILRTSADFDAARLAAGGYSVRWLQGPLAFSNVGLARLDLDWQSIGAVHEYWTAEGAGTIEFLPELWVDHVADGGVVDEKPDRNLRLLEAEFEEQPDNPRTQFYLAQTYFDLARYAEARTLYRQRIETGGWEEETWYAAYKAALCAIHMEQWNSGYGELLDVWNQRPGRAEPLYALARQARLRKLHRVALLAAEQALALDYPAADRLFIDTFANGAGPLEEVSISAYYAGHMERGRAACAALVHRRGLDDGLRDRTALNMIHYASPITTYDDATRVEIPSQYLKSAFVASVGSLARTRDGYRLVNRLVNYYHERGVAFMTRDAAGQFLTRNLMLELDRQLATRSGAEIDDGIIDEVADFTLDEVQVGGVEDLRLFRWKGAWWFTANSRHFGAQHLWQVVLGRLDASGTRIESLVPLDFTAHFRQEKNWMPIVHQQRLFLLYSADPTIVIEPHLETGKCRVVAYQTPAANLDRLRGSSPFVPFNGRLLGIVHDVAFADDRRTYLHRFIVLDPHTWMITHVSHPFTFLHTGVEYCCGLTWAHGDHELLISFSFEERESWIARIHRERVRDMLRPIESLASLQPLAGLGATAPPARMTPAPTPGTTATPSRQPRRRWPAR